MPARAFTAVEISTLESRLLDKGSYRDKMLIIAGKQVGHRITKLLSRTIGQVIAEDGDIVRKVASDAGVSAAFGSRRWSIGGHSDLENGCAICLVWQSLLPFLPPNTSAHTVW